MKRIFIIVLALFFSQDFTAQERPTQRRNQDFLPNITLKGKVMDTETGMPLEYATISMISKRENKAVDGKYTVILARTNSHCY